MTESTTMQERVSWFPIASNEIGNHFIYVAERYTEDSSISYIYCDSMATAEEEYERRSKTCDWVMIGSQTYHADASYTTEVHKSTNGLDHD